MLTDTHADTVVTLAVGAVPMNNVNLQTLPFETFPVLMTEIGKSNVNTPVATKRYNIMQCNPNYKLVTRLYPPTS